ncbi:MAG: NTP pyrophosphohydrolase [Candidatus Pacearchaeota archaeon]|nr:MAG: NTP pyrophosphohydrolase [Candidatus Pacearchaeota archaeon]
MPKISAGLLMYRTKKTLEVFLVHPGGPFWKNKDEGAWSIPKGEVEKNESFLEAAKREFFEETGIKPKEPFLELGSIKQKSGKVVYACAFKGDFSGFLTRQNMIEIEYPPKSGKKIKIPEVDKASFFTLEEAKKKIIPSQVLFLDRLREVLS